MSKLDNLTAALYVCDDHDLLTATDPVVALTDWVESMLEDDENIEQQILDMGEITVRGCDLMKVPESFIEQTSYIIADTAVERFCDEFGDTEIDVEKSLNLFKLALDSMFANRYAETVSVTLTGAEVVEILKPVKLGWFSTTI